MPSVYGAAAVAAQATAAASKPDSRWSTTGTPVGEHETVAPSAPDDDNDREHGCRRAQALQLRHRHGATLAGVYVRI